MLSQFSVKNYKSFRDEATFDMQATSISEHKDRVLIDKDGQKLLPISSIYGPNGGGKSNLLEAIRVLKNKILVPIFIVVDDKAIQEFGNHIIEPFAFDEKTINEPTEFEIFFRTDKSEYRYILHIKRDSIVYESLDRIKFETRRKSALFERVKETITLKGEFEKLKISDGLSETLPLLSYFGITYGKNEIVEDVINWFRGGIIVLNFGSLFWEEVYNLPIPEDLKSISIDLMKELDLDIIDYRVEKEGEKISNIFTKHNVNGYEKELNIRDESNGTRKLFALMPIVAISLLEGTVLVIDELDANIHPILLKHIIMMFCDMNINKKNAQLIFTSHDLPTMTSEVFRRDEIWFVAKGHNQNSKLYSLVEFKDIKGNSIRNDALFNKQYLEGKYGADPYLERIVKWEEINA